MTEEQAAEIISLLEDIHDDMQELISVCSDTANNGSSIISSGVLAALMVKDM